MQILIFEGIATSGKSTVIRKTREKLEDTLTVLAVGEDETHIPIMEQREELHVDFFKRLIVEKVAMKPDIILFDRLIMTQAYRAKVGLKPYEEIESILLKYNPITIYFKIEEDAIGRRVLSAMRHRDPEWVSYVKSKGDKDQFTNYYSSQQQGQLQLLHESKLPFKVFDTTNHDYETIVIDLMKVIQAVK